MPLGADGAALPLVSAEGRAPPVIVPDGVPPQTKATEVTRAGCIERISGVRPEILETLPDPFPAWAIWGGYQSAMDTAFPGVDFFLPLPGR